MYSSVLTEQHHARVASLNTLVVSASDRISLLVQTIYILLLHSVAPLVFA